MAARLHVVAVCTDTVEENAALKKELGITSYELYSDSDGAASQTWKVYNPESHIARPSTFVIARGGKLLFRYIGYDRTDRPSVDAILHAARSNSSKRSTKPQK